MKNFAIIETGGKQYRVSAGEKIKVEKLAAGDVSADGSVAFGKVLLRSEDGSVHVGAPYVANTAVQAKVLGTGRGKKKIVFKYHSKTRFRKKKGHRQGYSEVEIASV